MKGQVIKQIQSGCFIVFLIKLDDGIYGRSYTGKLYENYLLWENIKVGDLVDGLKWKDEQRKVIAADSVIHIRQQAC